MDIFNEINRLTGYGLTTGLIEKEDIIFTQNKLLEIFKLDGFPTAKKAETIPETKRNELEDILKKMLDYTADNNLLENNSVVYRDLFDTKIMGTLTARPSEIQNKFETLYKQNPKKATDWYYQFCQDTDYIRRYRVCKDLKWQTKTEYGKIDITINLSKPEKDPKAIAQALNAPKNGYPSCLLCKENEGYAGRVNHAARQNHRIIPIVLNKKIWGFQYSPYVYYNEHCIVFSYDHTPMKINQDTFHALFDFIKQFPHYTIGSNADLPIVGGSILTHNHFQGGNYNFPMAKAPVEKEFTIKGFNDVKAGIVTWPMSVLRLDSNNPERLIILAEKILETWKNYTDKEAFIFAQTGKTQHNTITPIARMRKVKGTDKTLFELALVLRNNITTEEHPLGVFHPHANLHHIKKEDIGLIEVMGLAVLPSRLKNELSELEKAILSGKDISKIKELAKHSEWVKDFAKSYKEINKNNISDILQNEVGKVFAKVLEDAGVFKRTPQGMEAFYSFIKNI